MRTYPNRVICLLLAAFTALAFIPALTASAVAAASVQSAAEEPAASERSADVPESGYTVEFTYLEKEYVLPGGGEAKLSEILTALAIEGEATAVSVSDEELFSVLKKDGEWILSSHKPFDTAESLCVSVGGETFRITVMDTAMLMSVQYVDANGVSQGTRNCVILDSDTPYWP